jgi:hypothetical protein
MLWGGDPSDPEGAGAAWAQRKVEEIDRAKEKRLASRIVAEYVAEVDRGAHDADSAKIDRLLEHVEKGYMRELTDEEVLLHAMDSAVAQMDEGAKSLLNAFSRGITGAERDLEMKTKSYGIDARTADAMADEIDAVLKRASETILKSQGNT